jgi:hypothetical protein
MAYPPQSQDEIPEVEAKALNAPLPPFTAAAEFRGHYPGFTFKRGDDGLGYYSDTPPATTPLAAALAVPLAPAGQSPVAVGMNKLSDEDQRNRTSDFESTSSKRGMSAKFPEPSPLVLGIHIACHGERLAFDIPVKPIKGVSISKFNLSGYEGCALIQQQSVSIMRDKHIARSLLHGWELAPSKEKYLLTDVSPIYHVMNCIDVEGACSTITDPPNGWIPKRYTKEGEIERGIWVAYKNEVIDLFTCTSEELLEFMMQKAFVLIVNREELLQQISRYIFNNVEPGQRTQIKTEQLFNLIAFFKRYKHIETVRIYDSSCMSEPYHFPRPLPPDTGFGGKRTKRRKSKRRKSKKR